MEHPCTGTTKFDIANICTVAAFHWETILHYKIFCQGAKTYISYKYWPGGKTYINKYWPGGQNIYKQILKDFNFAITMAA